MNEKVIVNCDIEMEKIYIGNIPVCKSPYDHCKFFHEDESDNGYRYSCLLVWCHLFPVIKTMSDGLRSDVISPDRRCPLWKDVPCVGEHEFEKDENGNIIPDSICKCGKMKAKIKTKIVIEEN